MKTKLDLLKQFYTFHKHTEVEKFLMDNLSLIEVLYEANKKIKEYFGELVQLTLEITIDPECETEYKELYLLIHTSFSVEKALDCLKQFDNEWWLNIPANIHKKLCIDIMCKMNLKEYNPDMVFPPGITLKETLEARNMSVYGLSKKTGVSSSVLKSIIRGSYSITPKIAKIFEKEFNVSAKFWLNLEKNYQKYLKERK